LAAGDRHRYGCESEYRPPVAVFHVRRFFVSEM
jgi:hypothetical protein